MPLSFFSFVFGVALAFLPIQERPLETWIVNFFRSVYRPTQFVWKKTPAQLEFLNEAVAKPDLTTMPLTTAAPAPADNQQKLQDYLGTMNDVITIDDLLKISEEANKAPPPPTVDKLWQDREDTAKKIATEMKKVRREVRMDATGLPVTVDSLANATGFALPTQDNAALAIQEKQQRLDEAEAINKKLLVQIEEMNQKLLTLSREHRNQTEESVQYQKEVEKMKKIFEGLNLEKEKLEKELETARKKTVVPYDPLARVKFVDKLPIDKAIDGKLPPNTIHGLVDDQNGQAISGVIVLIKNTQGAPVRALRTNKLGQFLASTPLESGTYYIELEKDGYTFDEVKIDLTGQTLSPIEIKAK